MITKKPLRRIVSEWEAFFQQLRIRLNKFFQGFDGVGRVGSTKKAHPKECDRLVILFQFTGGSGKSSQRIAHFVGGLVHRPRFGKVNPGDAQMRSMMERLVIDLAPLERARQFRIIHGRLASPGPN